MLREALRHYNLPNPNIVFIRHNENMTHMIQTGEAKYLLRIHKAAEGLNFSFQCGETPRYDFVKSEIELLGKITSETDLRVQHPVRNIHDEYITKLQSGDYATVLTWIEGDDMTNLPMKHETAYDIGRLIGRLHNHMADFHQPKRYCYDECMMYLVLNEITKAHHMHHISGRHYQCMYLFLHKYMDLLEKKKHQFTLIHADMNKSNLIYDNREIIPIDFSLSGYGLPETDLADMGWSLDDNTLAKYMLDGYRSISRFQPDDLLLDVCSASSLILYIAFHHGQFNRDENFEEKLNNWIDGTIKPACNKMCE